MKKKHAYKGIKASHGLTLIRVILLCFPILFVIVLIVDTKQNLIVSNDITFYYNDDYEKISDANQYDIAVRGSKSYIPKYETFEYGQYVTGFYVQDGINSLSCLSATFVLELQFPSLEEYNQFSLYEYSRITYDEEIKVYHNGYECRITYDDYAFTTVHAKMPYRCGILCQNEEYLTVRYVYYYDSEVTLDKNFENVFFDTYCDW